MRRCKPKKRSTFRRRRNMSGQQRVTTAFDTYARQREGARNMHQAESFLDQIRAISQHFRIKQGHKG